MNLLASSSSTANRNGNGNHNRCVTKVFHTPINCNQFFFFHFHFNTLLIARIWTGASRLQNTANHCWNTQPDRLVQTFVIHPHRWTASRRQCEDANVSEKLNDGINTLLTLEKIESRTNNYSRASLQVLATGNWAVWLRAACVCVRVFCIGSMNIPREVWDMYAACNNKYLLFIYNRPTSTIATVHHPMLPTLRWAFIYHLFLFSTPQTFQQSAGVPILLIVVVS